MGCVSFTFLLCDLPRQTPQGAATAKAETQYTVFRYMYVYMYCRWHCDAYPREANRGLLLAGAECHHARNGETSIGLSLAYTAIVCFRDMSIARAFAMIHSGVGISRVRVVPGSFSAGSCRCHSSSVNDVGVHRFVQLDSQQLTLQLLQQP
jgi:hypothetical protein